MTTLPELSDGLRLTNTGHAHLVVDDDGRELWLDLDGVLHGSLRARPDAAQLEALLRELILLRNSELASPRKAEPRGCPTPGACSCESLRAERDEAVLNTLRGGR